jgi:hypothetical protein
MVRFSLIIRGVSGHLVGYHLGLGFFCIAFLGNVRGDVRNCK